MGVEAYEGHSGWRNTSAEIKYPCLSLPYAWNERPWPSTMRCVFTHCSLSVSVCLAGPDNAGSVRLCLLVMLRLFVKKIKIKKYKNYPTPLQRACWKNSVHLPQNGRVPSVHYTLPWIRISIVCDLHYSLLLLLMDSLFFPCVIFNLCKAFTPWKVLIHPRHNAHRENIFQLADWAGIFSWRLVTRLFHRSYCKQTSHPAMMEQT